jgi:hypothetical protein
VTQEPDVEQGVRSAPQRPADVADEQGQPGDQGQPHLEAGEPVGSAELRQAVDDGGDAGREQQHADGVQAGAGAGAGPVLGQVAPGEVAADDAEWHVEQEDPAPVAQVQDDAAEHRADDRAVGMVIRDMTLPMLRPLAACMTNVVISTIMMPPPMPWMTRKAIRLGAFHAAAHSSDPPTMRVKIIAAPAAECSCMSPR